MWWYCRWALLWWPRVAGRLREGRKDRSVAAGGREACHDGPPVWLFSLARQQLSFPRLAQLPGMSRPAWNWTWEARATPSHNGGTAPESQPTLGKYIRPVFLKFYLQILPCQEWIKLVKYDQRRPRVEWRGSYGVRSGSAQTNNASRGRIVLCQGSVVWLTLLLPRLHKCWQCWCTIPLHRFTQPPSQLNFLSGHSRWEWERKNFSV